MDLPRDIDHYIQESFDYSLGLPVSTKTLELKLQASEDARRRLQDQYFVLHARLKEKDETLEKSRSEASMNAQALKKFVEENQKLALECANLLNQCSRWEKECSLYDHDREALMEFGNEADERAKEAEIRVIEVENELGKLKEEVQFYKHECQMRMVNESKASDELYLLRQRIDELESITSQSHGGSLSCIQCSTEKAENHNAGDSSALGTNLEGHLLNTLIASMIDKDNVIENARAFLTANSGVESCQRLLKLWESCSLSPSTQNVLALASEIKILQNDKEHLRINLTRAEEEVKVLFEENTILDEENKNLLRQYNRERHQGSGGKHSSSASAKGSKKKSSPKRSRSSERKIDYCQDSPREPLSPIPHNSPDFRMHKK